MAGTDRSNMNRRQLLGTLAGASVLALTGCLSGESPGPGGTDEQTDPSTDDPAGDTGTPTDGTDSDSQTDTDGPEETSRSTETPGDPEIVDETLTVNSSGCGTTASEGAVDFEDETVVVDGTTWGNEACYTAELERTTYDPETDELTVAVASVRTAEDHQPCADCIAEVDYTARVVFDGGLPGSVTLVHVHGDDRAEVATEDR